MSRFCAFCSPPAQAQSAEGEQTANTAINAHNDCRRRALFLPSPTMSTAIDTATAPAPERLSDGPLAGVRVLDLGTVYAAPITAMLLGDYGADVLKIEHPRGDPARTHGASKDGHGLWWKVISRNKRAATLVLSRPEGREIMERLVADADVLIENFRPGVMEKWGLGPDRLLELNPDLVMLRVTGFGQSGPYAQRRAFGTLAEAMSGLAHQTGQPDGPPTLPPFGLADGVAAISGAYAVMLALYHRDVDGGGGQVIDLSLLAPLLAILGPGPSAYDQLGIVPGRHGNRSTNNAPRNAYKTRDGRWVAISASATSIAERVMAVVGRPDIAEHEWFASARERVRHADHLDRIVGDWIAGRDFDAVMVAFQDAGAAIAPIYDVEQVVNDPHVRATGMITTVEDEDLGPLQMQNLPFQLDAAPGGIRFTGRRLGQDNEEIYTERLGFGPERVAQLRQDGVI
jgi:crotonobetainyl-CoA:carnitine CoA-transferase CaiB-like acyl-CoA transferase